jgi:hypothetical protein
MAADSNSKIAWHRARLKKNREALKALEVTRFTTGHDKAGDTQRTIADLRRKIDESEKCIATHDRQSRRPLGTDFGSLTNVSWSSWNFHSSGQR